MQRRMGWPLDNLVCVQQVPVTEEAKNEDVIPDGTNTQNLTATNTEESPAQGLPPFSAALLDKEEPPAKTETLNQKIFSSIVRKGQRQDY